MDSLKDTLLILARDRLRNMPGAVRQFQNDIDHTTTGQRLLVLADSLPAPVRMAADIGSAGAKEAINAHLLRIIDEWAKALPLPDAVPPLGVEQPKPTIAGDNHTPQRIPKNERPDLLVPLIEKAQRDATDPYSAAEIWPKLCSMAESKTRPLEHFSAAGIKWMDANDDERYLTKEALGDRLRRLKNKAKKPR